MGFTVLNSNIYLLKGTGDNFAHIATITHSVWEYMCFVDIRGPTFYIEEITGGSLNRIEDDSLHLALSEFCKEQGFLIPRPWHLLKDSHKVIRE